LFILFSAFNRPGFCDICLKTGRFVAHAPDAVLLIPDCVLLKKPADPIAIVAAARNI
jgi:hypothetical protein